MKMAADANALIYILSCCFVQDHHSNHCTSSCAVLECINLLGWTRASLDFYVVLKHAGKSKNQIFFPCSMRKFYIMSSEEIKTPWNLWFIYQCRINTASWFKIGLIFLSVFDEFFWGKTTVCFTRVLFFLVKTVDNNSWGNDIQL